MSSKGLLSEAVGVSASNEKSNPFLDKLFVRWFDRMVYPLIWEDPISDLEAMGNIEGQNMVCLTSGGCNILSYLSEKPAHIAAVDLNGAHLALLALKKTAAKSLTYPSFLKLFGQASLPTNDALMNDLIPLLPEFSRQYWTEGKFSQRKDWFTKNFYHQGALGDFIGFGHWIARRLGYDLTSVMRAKSKAEATEIFNRDIGPVFDHWLIRWFSAQVWVLYGLGIPPRQYDILKGDADHMADVLKERLRHLACDYDLDNNYFAWQAFARRFDTNHQYALPLYLQEAQFSNLKDQVDNVSIHHASVTDYLAQQPEASVDVYVFLDAQDWMDDQQLNDLWTQVNRTARNGSRVVFRAAGKDSPLEGRLDPALLAKWHTDNERNHSFWQQDRSAIYGGCFIYTYAV
jgi:S-adenosylmethionine-diacylglycerol 3-amino-3-carboxypropyl transferase